MKHEIEIPDLPEGWRAVAFREPRLGEHYLSDINTVIRSNFNNCGESNLIVEKIKPRRIVLEETGEIRQSCYLLKIDDGNLILPPGREYKIVEDPK